MTAFRPALPRRVIAWAGFVIVAVFACLLLAVAVRRSTSGNLRQLAAVEFTATAARERLFSAYLAALHDALLKAGTSEADASKATIQTQRQRMEEWLATRLSAAKNQPEKESLGRLSTRTASFFAQVDALSARSNAERTPLDRGTIVALDNEENRLRNMAGEYAAAHDDDLRALLQASLGSVLWMRDLVFVCVALLLAAIGVVVMLLYRDVVRPLHGQLVESEALLVKSEKLAALGTLAAGVAHEIRNPLTAIKARLYTLRRSQTSDDGKEDVGAITAEVDRLERIVRDVLGYARPANPEIGRVELSRWLPEFAAFVRAEVSARNIELAVEVAAEAPVQTDPNQLRQIMLNLVRNAMEALDGRTGRIGLVLRRERVTLRGNPSDVAVLAVVDDGPGIPPEVQARLFDPFFTTKAAGTGLGLSIVARLVENQGGEIAFESSQRAGTRFDVRLPIDGASPMNGGS